ncbi:transposase [Hydrogenophaga atypica]|uniref:Transposase n=1 Tax=Hydrogenophaga atypica TaxID=249409 RepID=A0ABW2QIE4_9BURK
MGWTPPFVWATNAHWSSWAWGSGLQTKGVRNACYSSRYLGRISKKGDRYLRMLLTHGARSVLRAAKVADGAGREVCGIRRWALDVQGRSNHNKATCALANKLARICFATLRDHTPFDEAARLSKKADRQSFALPT